MHNKKAYSKAHRLPRQYAEKLLIIEKGHQVYLTDISGKDYLDFASGIAVNALGYGRADFASLLAEQAEKLVHISNLFTTGPTLELAENICCSSPLPADQPWEKGKNPGYFAALHFGNSGTEANEAAIKYARVYHYRKKGEYRHKILAFENSFHGRSMGALSLTYPEKYRKPFAPLLPGAIFGRFNDPQGLEDTIDSEVGAIIIEPVQGEGGLHTMSEKFAAALNQICHERDILLIADEIQTGLGRCGTLYASETIGLRPDIITLSKPLAGGLPLSATLIKAEVNELLQIGDHASTFGGGPVTCAAANSVWNAVNAPGFLEGVRNMAAYLEERLLAVRDSLPSVFSSQPLRGRGLLRGLVTKDANQLQSLIASSMKEGLLVLRSGSNVLRLAPPLIIEKKHIDEMETILRSVLGRLT